MYSVRDRPAGGGVEVERKTQESWVVVEVADALRGKEGGSAETENWRLRGNVPLDAVAERQAAFKGGGGRQASARDTGETVKGAREEVGPQVSSTLSCGPGAVGSVMTKDDDTTGHAE